MSKGTSRIHVIKVFDTVEIAASGTAYNDTLDGAILGLPGTQYPAIDLNLIQCEGYGSLHLVLTGDGTLQVDAVYSPLNDGSTTFVIPEGVSALATDLTAGQCCIPLTELKLGKFLKLLLTETGGASTITVTGWLTLQ